MKISEIAKWCIVSEIHLPDDVRQQAMGIKPCPSDGGPRGVSDAQVVYDLDKFLYWETSNSERNLCKF